MILQQGVTLTSVQPVTITAEVPVSSGSADASNSGSSGSSSSGLSTGAKVGIGAGVGGGVGALLLAGLAFWLWRRRKQRVGDDFKWPELGDGTGSGATAAGLYPNPTHPTNNRFDMDDDELFDGEGTQAGHSAAGNMMSERDPSFLSSAAYSQSHPVGGGGGGYGAGMAGLGAGAAAAGGLAASQGGRSAYGGSDRGDYYSQDGHGQYSPPQSQQFHGGAGYQNPGYGGYEGGAAQPPFQQGGYNGGYPAGAAAPAAAAGGAALGRSGSIASTAANNSQVGAMPEYGDDQTGRRGGRNRLSVVNALDDVEE